MKCHYEILDIPRTADDTQIKTAYRKLALKWHPDKNLEKQEIAKEQFQLVQQAYEVLSDSHERAWYDNHREQILRGGHTNYEDNSLDLFQYFTATCYKGFGDDPKNFYSIYAEVFHKIASEEIEYLDDEADFELIPKFGTATSDYETVVRLFYAYWESFCTKKSYAWLSTHNINEIRDRRFLKMVEKENRKVQQKARKERNEEIRSLVAFVRKRDKRVIAYKKLLEEKAQQNRLKSEQNRLEQIRKKNAEIEEQTRNSVNHAFNQQYEEQLRKLEETYNKESESSENESEIEDLTNTLNSVINSTNGDDIDEFYDDDLYCVACDKQFKNECSYKNHETSKKHRQNVEILKQEMQKDENRINIEDEEINGKTEANSAEAEANGVISNGEEEEEEKIVLQKNKSKKSKKKVQSHDDSQSANEIDDLLLNHSNKQNEIDDDWGESSKKSSKKSKPKAKDKQTKVNESSKSIAEVHCTEQKLKNETESRESEIVKHGCATCNEKFDSKNKLFQHLKKTNHSVYLEKNEKLAEKGKSGKKKKT
uniref:DnaJ homolog subfamily C member 21 n=1 Tax=Corethrella appendiculata TaxID=1370023 RepID=U5EYP5_9DIPT